MKWLTFKDEEVVLVRLEEVEELDDTGVIDAAHDLDLFEDVGALNGQPRSNLTTYGSGELDHRKPEHVKHPDARGPATVDKNDMRIWCKKRGKTNLCNTRSPLLEVLVEVLVAILTASQYLLR
jgi:hypothetical protein